MGPKFGSGLKEECFSRQAARLIDLVSLGRTLKSGIEFSVSLKSCASVEVRDIWARQWVCLVMIDFCEQIMVYVVEGLALVVRVIGCVLRDC